MKALRLVPLLMPLLLLVMTRPVTAGPASVTKIPQDCFVGWAGIEADNLVHVVLLSGTGIIVESNDARGNALLQCGTQIDFGATVVAVDLVTGLPVPVQLLTIDQLCGVTPDACRSGGNGAVIFNFDNTGIACVPDGVPTTRYSERVTPSGQAQITCHLPD